MFRFTTVKPGAVPDVEGRPQAPHIMVSVFTRGLVRHVSTRLYFSDESAANAADSVLSLVPAARRATLVAESAGHGMYRWNVVLQGQGETVFFDI